MFQGSAPEGSRGFVKVVACRCPGLKMLQELSNSNREKKKILFTINAEKALLMRLAGYS
jgi:hypothetical protein